MIPAPMAEVLCHHLSSLWAVDVVVEALEVVSVAEALVAEALVAEALVVVDLVVDSNPPKKTKKINTKKQQI